MDTYDETQDPDEHVEEFMIHMNLNEFTNVFFCCVFPSTLKGVALSWADGKEVGLVRSFRDFIDQFRCHFGNVRKRRKKDQDIFAIKKGWMSRWGTISRVYKGCSSNK